MTYVSVLLQLGVVCFGMSVHDGDTFRDETCTKHRLWGVDAVELDQTCDGEGCGILAREALRHALANGALRCSRRGTSYDRVVSQCWAGDVDVGRMMVRLGWAIDVPQYSGGTYAAEEREARKAKRGMWAYGSVMTPQQWRQTHVRYGR